MNLTMGNFIFWSVYSAATGGAVFRIIEGLIEGGTRFIYSIFFVSLLLGVLLYAVCLYSEVRKFKLKKKKRANLSS